MANLIFQCSHCRALGSTADVVVETDRAGLRCGSCAQTSWLPIAGSSAAERPPAPVLVPVPVPVPVAMAVATPAALAPVFDEETVERIRKRLSTQPEPAPQQLEVAARFDRLLTSTWGSESEHKKLLKSAALEGELAFVGGRYRAVLDVVRDEPRAKAAQQELLTLAMASMSQQRELGSPGEAKAQNRTAIIAVVVALAVLAVGGMFMARSIIGSFNSLDQIEQ
ncbi:MAG: hypothetical protein Q8O67_09715 [Deltaproteobacteria bacterium]|nr:hypothetical protein [Deltaproteobacteria bacterium]